MTSHGSRRRVRAVLMDLDGTLYRQAPLRRRMLVELALLPFSGASPLGAARTLRRLQAFRAVREELRALGRAERPLELVQYEEPARRLREPVEAVRATVAEWIHARPLRHLAPLVRPGTRAALEELARRRVRLGVFSDYPVDAKLERLGLADLVPLRLCATDAEINAFKPHPRGFLEACARWELEPAEVLYVGDRVLVDGAGAHAAGMRCAIVSARDPGGHFPLRGMDLLPELVQG